jgi:hypothetical protein
VTLEKAHELIAMHVSLGSGYNQNAAKLVLGEVMRDHGQVAVDALIREYDLESLWDIKPGTKFASAFKS